MVMGLLEPEDYKDYTLPWVFDVVAFQGSMPKLDMQAIVIALE